MLKLAILIYKLIEEYVSESSTLVEGTPFNP
jgi:hypothetical protein